MIFTLCLTTLTQGQVTNPSNSSLPGTEFLGWDNTSIYSKDLDIINQFSGKKITFQNNGATPTLRMLIDANGNIGMGQGGLFPCPTSPGWSLDVAGDINI